MQEARAVTAAPAPPSPSQVRLAEDVGRYLDGQLDRRITTAQLAERFGVSRSQLKASFRAVFGLSVHAYARQRKMRAAARLLLETDRTVLDIAGQMGYDNASKFAAAFRGVMGLTPSQYRGRMGRP